MFPAAWRPGFPALLPPFIAVTAVWCSARRLRHCLVAAPPAAALGAAARVLVFFSAPWFRSRFFLRSMVEKKKNTRTRNLVEEAERTPSRTADLDAAAAFATVVAAAAAVAVVAVVASVSGGTMLIRAVQFTHKIFVLWVSKTPLASTKS